MIVALLICAVVFVLALRFSPGLAHELLSSFFEFRDIPKEVNGKLALYLRRYFITPRRWVEDPDGTTWPKRLRWIPRKYRRQIFLHNIHLSDARVPHDHPWGFISFILWGCYIEFVFGPIMDLGRKIVRQFLHKIRRAFQGRVLKNPATHVHFVKIVRPVWSLVIAEHATREWGFWTEDGWQDWRTYLNLPNDPTEPEDRFPGDLNRFGKGGRRSASGEIVVPAVASVDCADFEITDTNEETTKPDLISRLMSSGDGPSRRAVLALREPTFPTKGR